MVVCGRDAVRGGERGRSTCGYGGSSYIDSVILRDRDPDLEDEDPTRDERLFYCQTGGWRADVSAIITHDGKMVEWIKYSAYGEPTSLPAGDTDSDRDWDATDSAVISLSSAYEVRQDADLNGTVTGVDATHATSITGGYQTLGRGVLTSSGVENRIGYAGYRYDPRLGSTGRHWYHVRHRVYQAHIGRWLTRDPLGYVDGMSLYEYVRSAPVVYTDPSGLSSGVFAGSPPSVVPEPIEPPCSKCPGGYVPSCPLFNPELLGMAGWCFDPFGAKEHCGLTCYRSYGTGTWGGQQCCYNSDGTLNQDPNCMGTIDGTTPAIGEGADGTCTFDTDRFLRHWLQDIFDEKWFDSEVHCCMRWQGIPSGNPGRCVTDEEIRAAWVACSVAVESGMRFCDSPNYPGRIGPVKEPSTPGGLPGFPDAIPIGGQHVGSA